MFKIVLKDKKVSEDYLTATFQFVDRIRSAKKEFIKPGEFLMLKNRSEPILAKPFSVLNTNINGFEMLIRIIGRFTSYLSEAVPGEIFFYRGPYGTAFEKKLDMSKRIITIGGGCGAAPILFFNNRYPQNVEKSIVGFKNEGVKRLMNFDEAVFESVSGKTVIDELNEYLKKRKHTESPIVLACGSLGMCRALHEHSKEKNYQLFVSLDERMGCGMGMCKGCPIKTTSGIKMICKDGPVFDSDEIIWEW